ncbi:hypothetical protein BEH94_09980 [Candidatus Altiarchaeales archaeon WOR_SM1_SCG]|nr:hypothetical protein BEH94_09980 [Candidatus Altiarchaeales archaeon WOR_SM1_SCG]
MKKNLKNNVYENLNEKFKTGNFVKFISHGLEVKDAISLAKEFTEGKNRILILINVSGGKANVVCASSNPDVNAGGAAKKISNKLGGGGHGDEKLGVGGGKAESVEDVLAKFEI